MLHSVGFSLFFSSTMRDVRSADGGRLSEVISDSGNCRIPLLGRLP